MTACENFPALAAGLNQPQITNRHLRRLWKRLNTPGWRMVFSGEVVRGGAT